MPRGGYRGGGRPSSFRHGPTQTIRVPIVLADEVLRLAQKLDRGEALVNDTKTNSIDTKTKNGVLDLRGIKVYKVRDNLTVSLDDLKQLFDQVLISEDKLPKPKKGGQ